MCDDLPRFIPARWPKPESGTFGSTRHNSLILSILASVVKSFPAIRSMLRRPRAASRRSPAAVIEPSGNAIAAATPNRSGVSGVTWSGDGVVAIAQHIDVYLTINRKSRAALKQLHDAYLHDWNRVWRNVVISTLLPIFTRGENRRTNDQGYRAPYQRGKPNSNEPD